MKPEREIRLGPGFWDRMKDEPAKAYAAFLVYLAKGTRRNLPELAGTVLRPYSTIKKWSMRYSWAMRASEYDAALAELVRAEAEDFKREELRRHTETAIRFQGIVEKRLAEYFPGLNGEPPQRSMEELPLGQAMQTYRLAVEVERTALGLPARVERSELTSPAAAPLALTLVPFGEWPSEGESRGLDTSCSEGGVSWQEKEGRASAELGSLEEAVAKTP